MKSIDFYIEYSGLVADEEEIRILLQPLRDMGLEIEERTFYIKNAYIDLVDYDCIAFAFYLINEFTVNGMYDAFKNIIIKLFGAIRKKGRGGDSDFTLEIGGIPKDGGTTAVSLKISGDYTDDDRRYAIEGIIALTNDIASGKYDFIYNSKCPDFSDKHIFEMDKESFDIKEIDVDNRIKKNYQDK